MSHLKRQIAAARARGDYAAVAKMESIERNEEKAKAHPGFKRVASKIARKQGVSQERAEAILAASSRRASPAAKRANPRLNRVQGAS